MGEGDSVILHRDDVTIEGNRNLYNYTFTVHDTSFEDLLRMAEAGDTQRVRQFLESHPNLPMRRDGGTLTPLHAAARSGDPELIRLLLDRQAGIEETDAERGATPLAWAAFYGRTAAVEELLRHGARVTVQAIDNARAGVEGRLNDVSNASTEEYEAVLRLLEKGPEPRG